MIRLKKVIKTIIDIILALAIIVVAYTWISDYIKVNDKEKPVYCKEKESVIKDDVTLDECDGLGYKVYTYTYTDKKIIELVPFWQKPDV